MKIFSLPVLMLCVIPTLSEAQSMAGQVELSVSAGAITLSQIGYSLSLTGPVISSASPTTSVNGRYYLSDRFAIGASGGFLQFNGKDYNKLYPDTAAFKETALTIAVELIPIYMLHKNVQLYGLYGFGVSNVKDVYKAGYDNVTQHLIGLNVQITPIGIRVGDNIAGFLELGLGYKGLINGGIAYKFGEKFNKKYLQPSARQMREKNKKLSE